MSWYGVTEKPDLGCGSNDAVLCIRHCRRMKRCFQDQAARRVQFRVGCGSGPSGSVGNSEDEWSILPIEESIRHSWKDGSRSAAALYPDHFDDRMGAIPRATHAESMGKCTRPKGPIMFTWDPLVSFCSSANDRNQWRGMPQGHVTAMRMGGPTSIPDHYDNLMRWPPIANTHDDVGDRPFSISTRSHCSMSSN